MAVNKVYWGRSDDIHLVAGAASRRLEDELLLEVVDDDARRLITAREKPTGVTVRFRAAFKGTYAGSVFSGFGVAVDEVTGEVTAGVAIDEQTGELMSAQLPAAPRLWNFLLCAQVTDKTVSPSKTFEQRIRIHVHAAVTDVWLTPNPLTVRATVPSSVIRVPSVRFSVLARFDDRTVGDISELPGLSWATTSTPPGEQPAITVDPGSGWLRANVETGSVEITVTLPASNGGMSASALAFPSPPWSTEVTAKLLSDPTGAARMTDPLVTNVLFLPDGFVAGQEPLFERTVQQIVDWLQKGKPDQLQKKGKADAKPFAAQPFGLCSSQINYWTAWIESVEPGTSPLYEIVPKAYQNGRGFGRWMLDDADAPLLRLLDAVGLPVPAHGEPGVTFTAQQQEWSSVFGPDAHAHADAKLYDRWKALANRCIVNECDTAFGMALGARPSAEYANPPRFVTWHRYRTKRGDLDEMFRKMSYRGAVIGGVWDSSPGKDLPPGKDCKNIVVLCAGSPFAGAASDNVIGVSLVENSAVRLVGAAGAGSFATEPWEIPATLAPETKAVVAHELAHQLGLGDEYCEPGDRWNQLPAENEEEVNRINQWLNLQDAKSAAAADNEGGLDPRRLKWNWPRIAKAGVLVAEPSWDEGLVTLILHKGHANPFKQGDIVRLRTRPLGVGIEPSPELRVVCCLPLEEKLIAEPVMAQTPAGSYPSGSIVYVQRESPPVPPASRGEPLTLIAPPVHKHMKERRIPLNVRYKKEVLSKDYVCSPQRAFEQPALNYPPEITIGPGGIVRWHAWLVGAYEGGGRYGCGVYHPTGACQMRATVTTLESGTRAAYGFCPVCRYILVDRLDPSKHGEVDALYPWNEPKQ